MQEFSLTVRVCQGREKVMVNNIIYITYNYRLLVRSKRVFVDLILTKDEYHFYQVDKNMYRPNLKRR